MLVFTDEDLYGMGLFISIVLILGLIAFLTVLYFLRKRPLDFGARALVFRGKEVSLLECRHEETKGLLHTKDGMAFVVPDAAKPNCFWRPVSFFSRSKNIRFPLYAIKPGELFARQIQVPKSARKADFLLTPQGRGTKEELEASQAEAASKEAIRRSSKKMGILARRRGTDAAALLFDGSDVTLIKVKYYPKNLLVANWKTGECWIVPRGFQFDTLWAEGHNRRPLVVLVHDSLYAQPFKLEPLSKEYQDAVRNSMDHAEERALEALSFDNQQYVEENGLPIRTSLVSTFINAKGELDNKVFAQVIRAPIAMAIIKPASITFGIVIGAILGAALLSSYEAYIPESVKQNPLFQTVMLSVAMVVIVYAIVINTRRFG